MMALLDWIVDWWVRQCPHDGAHVMADLHEGCASRVTKYCRRCGSVRDEYSREWRRPRPLWYPR